MTLFQFHFHFRIRFASFALSIYAHLQIVYGNNEIWSSQFWNVDIKFKIKIISLVPKVALIIVFFYFYSLWLVLSLWLTLLFIHSLQKNVTVNMSEPYCFRGLYFVLFCWIFFSSLWKTVSIRRGLCISNFFQWIFEHMCMTTINFCQCHKTYRIAFCPW